MRDNPGVLLILGWIGALAAISIVNRLQSGHWQAGVPALAMFAMASLMFIFFMVYGYLEKAYGRWKNRRQRAKGAE